LICWHFTRFYLLAFWTAMAGAFLFSGGGRQPAIAAGVMLLAAAAAGVLSPVMRSSALLVSPAMMAGCLVTAVIYYDARHDLRFLSRLALLLAGVVVIIIVLSFGHEEYAYGHVWDLLRYKASCLLMKPADPADLSFEGRLLWNGPFNTPSPFFLVYRYGLLLPLSLAAFFLFFRRRRRAAGFGDILVVFLAFIFLAANIMVQRLTIFGAFFLGLVVVYFFSPPAGSLSRTDPGRFSFFSYGNRGRLSWIIAAACLVFQIREAVLCDRTVFAEVARRLIPDDSPVRLSLYAVDDIAMLNWIRSHTPEKAVFLSNLENSPSILAYTGRAINLHPKYEVGALREKYRTALFTLFGEDEEALYRLLDSLETDYYLYPVRNLLDAGPEGQRYVAGLSEVSRKSLICRLHFEPDGFRRLRLVYRNRSYQIYRVIDPAGGEEVESEYVVPYFPVYDPALFNEPGDCLDGCFNDALTPDVMARVDYAIRTMNRAGEWLSVGDRRMTMESIKEALTIGLPDGRVYSRAADYALRLGNPDRAFAYIRMALACDPENIEFRKLLARIHAACHEPRQALALDPGYAPARLNFEALKNGKQGEGRNPAGN